MTKALGILRGDFGRVALLDMDTSLIQHAHHHCHVILKVSGPDQSFVVQQNPLPLREDTAVLVNAWEQHHYPHQAHEQRTVFLALYIEPTWLAGIDRTFKRCTEPAFFRRPGVVINGRIQRLRAALVDCILDGTVSPGDVEAIILDLTTTIANQFAEPDVAVTAPDNANDFRIRRAIRFMYENHRQATSLDEIARVSGLSRPHFNYLFRYCTGVSPAVYSNAIRIEAAVRALSDERDAIRTLSHSLHFSAASNFTRFFQQHSGLTPRQFRRALMPVDQAAVR